MAEAEQKTVNKSHIVYSGLHGVQWGMDDEWYIGMCLWELENTHSIITIENRANVDGNVSDNKDLGNHLLH